jgi:type IV secretion system protein VirB6
VKNFVLSIFLCLFACNVVFANFLCSKGCVDGRICPKVENLGRLKPVENICPKHNDLGKDGLGNALIGWGRSCTIPGGEQTPAPYSCISTGNVMGQILDTVLTLGIGIIMRESFCSFSPGIDNRLEGAIIHKSIFDRCNTLSGEDTKNNCTNCILKGKVTNPSGNGCLDPPANSPDPLNIGVYARELSEKCNGIPNLEKPLLDENGAQVYEDNIPVYCPITRCNIPTNNIMAKYYDEVSGRAKILPFFGFFGIAILAASALAGDCCDIVSLRDNQVRGAAFLGIVRLRGIEQGDRICAQMRFTTGFTTLACKPRITPEIIVPDNACFMNNILKGGLKSKWVFPITSQLVQIVTEVFNSMFKGMIGCQNGLTAFQDNMKSLVSVLLILYVIFFGFRMVMGEKLGKKDLFMFILKFGLVVYFSVGDFNSATTIDTNGLFWLRESLTTATSSFSNMVVAAANPKICDFSQVSYDEGYGYLKMWDALDCKLSFYLGFSSPTDAGLSINKIGTVTSQIGAGIFNLLRSLVFSGNFIILLFIFAFGLFLLSLVVYFTHLYIIAMVAITMMIFFGPIFVPLALFDRTKGYFDKWFRLLLGYALQPVVVVAVVSFMIATFDTVIYSDCNFTQKEVSAGKPYWVLDANQSEVCKSSLGYNLAALSLSNAGKYQKSSSANGDGNDSLFTYNVTTKELLQDLIEGLMLCTFFAFLFYFFSSQIGTLAEELTGAPSLAKQAIGPTAVFDATVNTAVDTLKHAIKPETKKLKPTTEEEEEKDVEVSSPDKAGQPEVSEAGNKDEAPEVSERGAREEE